MQFQVLGPLAAVHDGPDGHDRQQVDVGGFRQQVVLAVLLLEAPRLVAVDALVDAVWPDAPPATARAQVQICISRLRHLIDVGGPAATIVTRPPGYGLELGGATLDLHAFDAAVAEARTATAAGRLESAAELLRGALALWQGPPLAGIDSAPVRDAATRLAERRLAVLEDWLQLELRLGRHAEVVDAAAAEVDRHPLRERLRGQLMLALYRSGRQAEALQEFQRARRTVVDELGLEPGEELRRLEQAVLRDDPSLLPPSAATPAPAVAVAAAAPPVPRMLPAPIADFTGREPLLAELLERLSGEGPDGTVPIAVVGGPGGVGKTVLAVQAAHRLAERFPDGQLYATMRGTTVPVRAAQALERFLRALGVPGGQVPEDLDERSELYRASLTGRRVLVVLDDIASVAQVLPLLPPDGGSAVLVTSRRRVTALPGAHRLELGSFPTDDGVDLLERVVGADRVGAEPCAAAELVQRCGHLPLAVRIAAARLAARPHWSLATMVDRLSDEAGQLDELRHEDLGVRASLLLAYETLEPSARELLRLLSLVDAPDLGGWAATAVLDVPDRVAQDVLGELVEMHLVDVTLGPSPAATRYSLHDLVRLFARERAAQEDDAARREDVLRRYLATLLHLLDEAHRRVYGGDFLVVHSAAPRHALGERVEEALLREPLGFLTAEHHSLVAAVAQAAAVGQDALCWDLAVSGVTLYEARAHFDDWRETHAVALEAARSAGDRTGEAAVRYSLGSLGAFEQRFDVAQEQLAAALGLFTELGSDQGVAMVLRNQAFVERMLGDDRLARSHNERALAVFAETGDRVGQAHVLSSLAAMDLDAGDDELALSRLTDAAAICREIANRRVGAQVVHRLGELHLARGHWDTAREAFAQVLDFARETGDPVAEVYGLVGTADALLRQGEHEGVRDALDRAGQLAHELGEQRMRVRALGLLSDLALADGEPDAALSAAQEAVRCAQALGVPSVVSAAREQLDGVQSAGAG